MTKNVYLNLKKEQKALFDAEFKDWLEFLLVGITKTKLRNLKAIHNFSKVCNDSVAHNVYRTPYTRYIFFTPAPANCIYCKSITRSALEKNIVKPDKAVFVLSFF